MPAPLSFRRNITPNSTSHPLAVVLVLIQRPKYRVLCSSPPHRDGGLGPQENWCGVFSYSPPPASDRESVVGPTRVWQLIRLDTVSLRRHHQPPASRRPSCVGRKGGCEGGCFGNASEPRMHGRICAMAPFDFTPFPSKHKLANATLIVILPSKIEGMI